MRADVAALLVQGMEGGGLPVVANVLSEWTTVGVGEAGRLAVPVVIEAAGAPFLDSTKNLGDRGVLDLEVYLYAVDTSGAVVAHIARTVGIQLDRYGEALSETGVRFVETIDLPKGHYSLRILVLDPASRIFGLAIEEIEVVDPGNATETVWISSPRIQSACSPWILARVEGPLLSESSDAGGAAMIASVQEGSEVRPVLVPGRLFHVSAVAAASSSVGRPDSAISVRLSRDGSPEVAARVETATTRELASGARHLDVAFELPSLPAGLHQLTISTARSDIGEREGKSPAVDVWVTETGEVEGNCPTWTSLRRSAAAASGATDHQPTIESAGSRRRRAAILAAYLEVLQELASSGDLATAVDRLVEVETGIIESDSALRELLQEVEMSAAQQLSGEDPECLLPILMLHLESYEEHYRERRFGLAGHSRVLVGRITDWFVEEGSGAESPGPLAALLTSLAELAERHHMMFESQILLRKVLDLSPEHETARLLLALSYERVGFHNRARDQLKELLTYNSKNMEARLRLAIMLARQGQFEVSIQQLRRLIREGPEDWILDLSYQTLAQSLGRLGRHGEAVSTLKQAVGRLPGEQRLHVQMAYWLDRSGRREEAAEILKRIPYRTTAESSHRLRYTEHASSSVALLRRELRTNVSVRLPRLGVVVARMKEASRQ
jgi:Flp pilus assembly protein TadD